MDVKMRSGGGKLDVSIAVPSSRVKAALQGEMAELEQALEDLHGGRAQAELHDSSAESGSGHEPGEQHSGGAPREDGDEIPFPAASRSTQKDYSWAEDGKLNLLV